MARVALSFAAWKAGEVSPATVEVPVQVIEAAESAQHVATFKGHEDAIRQVAWAPDGKTLASLAVVSGVVKLWNVAERKERATLQADLGNSFGLAFTPDGKTLVVGHYQNTAQTGLGGRAGVTGGITRWDPATGRRTGLLQHQPPRGVVQLALSSDGKTIATFESWRGPALTLWDLPSGRPSTTLRSDDWSSALTFAPDGKVLAWGISLVKDRRLVGAAVHRRDLSTGQDLPVLPNTVSKNLIHCLAFSPDGLTLAGADSDGNILLWDTTSASVRGTLKQAEQRQVTSLDFSRDGRTLAAAVGDRRGHDHDPGLIVLWDVASGRQRATLTGHTNAVLSVAFSPDGKVLASGSADRTVRLWDLATMLARGQIGSR